MIQNVFSVIQVLGSFFLGTASIWAVLQCSILLGLFLMYLFVIFNIVINQRKDKQAKLALEIIS